LFKQVSIGGFVLLSKANVRVNTVGISIFLKNKKKEAKRNKGSIKKVQENAFLHPENFLILV
jgi:hypothetical protein